MKIYSIPAFAEECRDKNNEQIHSLFESLDKELRDEIYYTFWSYSPEPLRAALIQIGARYNIFSLIDY